MLHAVETLVSARADEAVSDLRTRIRPGLVEFAVPAGESLPGGLDAPADGALAFRPVVTASPASPGDCPGDAISVFCDADEAEILTLAADVLPVQSVQSAEAGQSKQTPGWIVTVDLTSAGASALTTWSGAHIGERLAIVRDDEVLTAPTVQSALPGSIEITGQFTEADASLLAAQLRIAAAGVSWTVQATGDRPGG